MSERFIDVAVVARQERLTVAEAAYRVGMSEGTIRNYLRKGLIHAELIEGRYVFNASEVESVLRPSVPASTTIEPTPPIVTYPFMCGVYFFQCQDFIKIGVARNPFKRLAEFSLYNPLPVTMIHFIRTKTVNEARQLEWQLHARFAAARYVREWFRRCPEIDVFITTDKARMQTP